MELRLDAWVGGRYVDLIDVLRMVGDNRWTWRLDEFDGMFKPSSRRDFLALEQQLREGGGLLFGWSELLSFAEDVHQTIWGKVIALGLGGSETVLALDCFDSTWWELAAADGDRSAIDALTRIERLWPIDD